ncbi:amidohydrolase family protein [Streptomyces clavuligerus]|uniref:amidohydrolase family protein n=1 Tax=Streptomyces clavuligerus TaxID=1901 RepID=UPI0001851CC5|nr:amidohydrolase family protein [Streptomyces clavuligerus]MBY6303994.1 amidohydrolase [Streptomyces clavuligerus]QPL64051.1 amidohydrolase [Streptomyces clavuligerus]QPL70079.1 amidohydrolase [Streptomyces clavuligerus]QPL76163.1 amidohydrolase [Streptomyces clavuligerus]QPL82189.1 amidohydrolase [Streptomyces clavuligerus]
MRIDVHAHVWTDEYLDLLEGYGKTDTAVQRGLGAGLGDREIEARFELMDSAGVTHQVISAPPQSPHFADPAQAVRAARFVNDQYAEAVRRWPDRFLAFGSLPFPHTDAALEELARVLDQLGMVGVATTTSVLGRSAADPAYEPVFAELDRREAVLYVHPAGCGAGSPLISEHRLTWSIGAPIEDTVAIMQLILAGVPSRYPGMRIIASHLGGALPMLALRADHQVGWEAPDTPELPSAAARRLWYDSVGHGHTPALLAAVETFGADRIVLGTDFPYEDGDLFRTAVAYIEHAGLPGEQIRQILDRNAVDVLGLRL